MEGRGGNRGAWGAVKRNQRDGYVARIQTNASQLTADSSRRATPSPSVTFSIANASIRCMPWCNADAVLGRPDFSLIKNSPPSRLGGRAVSPVLTTCRFDPARLGNFRFDCEFDVLRLPVG